MMNILFWNIKKKDTFTSTITDIVKEECVDIVAFAELPNGKELFFEQELIKADSSFKYLPPIKPTKVEVFYRYGVVNIIPAYDGKRINVNRIHSPIDNNDYYICFCHLKDAYTTDRNQLPGYARRVMDELLEFEKGVKSKRTIICGDFNMDPYDQAMLECDSFNAMQTALLAMKRQRNVEGSSYEMFYNPMWGLLGDLHGRDVPGTFYYSPSEPIQTFWHLIDQVIIRPDVIPVFVKQRLKIVTKGKTYNLLNRNNNISDKYSDHLPILFTLNI